MNILISDDDPLMIRLLSTTLRNAGFATFVAYDVIQAMTTIRRSRIDAVVLDMSMPGGSGADVIRRLKLSTRTGAIPIVVVSGSIDPAAQDDILALGADAFFPKPPDLAALVSTLQALTSDAGTKKAQTAAAAASEPLECYSGA